MSGVAAMDIVAEFEQMVTDHMDVLKRLVGNNERNTWRLVGKPVRSWLHPAPRLRDRFGRFF